MRPETNSVRRTFAHGVRAGGGSEEAPDRTGLLVYGRGGVCGGRLVAVEDLTSGRRLWAREVPAPSGPVDAGGSLVLTAPGGGVPARDLATGAERRRAPLPAGATATGLRAGPDRVLVTSRSATATELLALDPTTGTVVWPEGRAAVVSRGAYSHRWDLDPRTGTGAGEPAVLGDRPVAYPACP